MIIDSDNLSDADRFQHLLAVLSSRRFLKMEGLGNEVPFFISPYPPEKGVAMQGMEKQLVNRLEQRGVSVLVIDLYDLAIELLRERGIWEEVLAIEESVSKEELKELLKGVLDPETHLLPDMAEKMQAADFDVKFITGGGQVYPYIRSHNVVNNLQSTAKDRTTVIFFPGKYTHSLETGASLDLFGRLHDDKYYRAFNIYDIEV
jgi:hypothetical protein